MDPSVLKIVRQSKFTTARKIRYVEVAQRATESAQKGLIFLEKEAGENSTEE